MRTDYQPEIFNNMLESIDLQDHLIATYYIHQKRPGEKFLDHLAFVQSLAMEGSTGTWQKIKDDTLEVREALTCKLVGYYQIPSRDEDEAEAVIQFAMSVDAFMDNLPMMMLSFAGNFFVYCDDLRLLDVSFPPAVTDKYPGPKFSYDGIRKLIGIEERRPLSMHIIKPKMGMTPKQTGAQCYETAIGGVDMIKDDEITSDTYNCTYEDRLKYVMEALHKAKETTGKMPIYLCSITDEAYKVHDRARKLVEMGGNGILLTYTQGFSSFAELTKDPDINVPIMLHPSHMVASTKCIAWPVWGKLARLFGADLMLTPYYYSSVPMVSQEEGVRTAQIKQAPFRHIKPTIPMPAAGTYPGTMPVILAEYGTDIVVPSGGGMLGHPDGYTAGAKAWQQAIRGAMDCVTDEEFIEFAKKPENIELRHALEKWGMPHKPQPTWLRANKELHPKPIIFD